MVGLNQNCLNLSRNFKHFEIPKEPKDQWTHILASQSTGKQTPEKLAALQQKLNDWTIDCFCNNDFFFQTIFNLFLAITIFCVVTKTGRQNLPPNLTCLWSSRNTIKPHISTTKSVLDTPICVPNAKPKRSKRQVPHKRMSTASPPLWEHFGRLFSTGARRLPAGDNQLSCCLRYHGMDSVHWCTG